MGNHNVVINNLDNPHELERLYRTEPEAFEKAFLSAWEQKPDSPVLKVWYERLYFKEAESRDKASTFQKDFLFMVMFALLAGMSTRILYYFIEQETIHYGNLVFGGFPFLAAYFLYKHRPNKQVFFTLLALFLLSFTYANVLLNGSENVIFLSYLHLPIFLWVLVGFAYTGDQYRSDGQRLAYLKFNGEFLILYVCMMLGFAILSAVTISLFGYLNLSVSEFYFKNVSIPGGAALAVVATYLVVSDLKLTKNVAQYIAKIFSPLVLITLLVYLVAIVWVRKNPFLDREFLLTFNVVLLIVLAITIFSITERGTAKKRNIFDAINYALIALALIIDAIALSAIIFRLSSYGISPNRIAVLGANILIWINFIWVIFSYTRFLQNKADITVIQQAITKYLPVYGLWAAFVTFCFPLIFR